MANYITCKDNRAFAYAETTNKGYYEVLSVSEDGNSCRIKTVWHENKTYIGREYDIPIDRASEDFMTVEEIVVIGALERQALQITGWATPWTTQFHRRTDITNNAYSCTSTDFNMWEYTLFRETREFMFVPNEESTSLPTITSYCGTYECYDARDVKRKLERVFNRSYEYSEGIIVIPDNFDEIVAEVTGAMTDYSVIDFPNDLKLQLRSTEHKVVALAGTKRFVYLTNLKSDHIIFSSAVLFAEQIGKPLSEDAKAALLSRNQEAYCAAIYKNIDVIMAGMEERAKAKMFEDFNSNFNGMLIKPLNDAVKNARQRYNEMSARLNEAFVALQDANARLFYAQHGIQNGEDEFISFIGDAKSNIVSLKANPGRHLITFCIRTFLTYWDDDLWDITRKSDDRFAKLPNWKKLMLDEIFRSRTVKLLIEQKFDLDTHYCEAQNNGSYDATPYGEGTRGLRNPHISEYNCWGTHKNYIRDSLERADYVQAYSQSVACISGLTLSDSPVMSRFFNYIEKSSYANLPCLYLVETGTYISMNEYKQLVEGKKWEA